MEGGRNLTSTIVSLSITEGVVVSFPERRMLGQKGAARLCYIPGDLDAFTKYSRNVERDR